MNEPNKAEAQPANVQGEAARTAAKPAVVRATIHVKRKATGQTENYQVTGTEQPKEPDK